MCVEELTVYARLMLFMVSGIYCGSLDLLLSERGRLRYPCSTMLTPNAGTYTSLLIFYKSQRMDIAEHGAALGSRHISAGRTGGKKIFLESSFSFANAESNETRSTGALASDTH